MQLWGNARVVVNFHGYSQTAQIQLPNDRQSTYTAADGTYALLLWVNQQGDYSSFYTIDFPNQTTVKIILTGDLPAEIGMSELVLRSVSKTDPIYPSLIAVISQQLAAAGRISPVQIAQVQQDVSNLNTNVLGLQQTVQQLQETTDYVQIYNGALL